MRGASTPFQFLETPMDDYMEVSDESLDILMIQTKKSHNSELVVKLTEERDNISAEKSQIEKEKNQLVGKVEELEAALSVKEEEVKEFTEKVEVSSMSPVSGVYRSEMTYLMKHDILYISVYPHTSLSLTCVAITCPLSLDYLF